MPCHFCDKLAQLDQRPGDDLVGQFTHSVAFLGPWQYYIGYCILVSRLHATEIFELPDDSRRGFFDELTMLARALHAEFQPRKLNYELLGNQVPHLHWHLFPRYQCDPEFMKPAWIEIDRAERDAVVKARLVGDANRKTIISRIRSSLAKLT